MKQEKLRLIAKHLNVNGVSYKEMAEAARVQQSSFYGWVNGNYSFSSQTARLFEDWIYNELIRRTNGGKKYQTVKNLISLLTTYELEKDEVLRELKQYDYQNRYFCSNKGRIFSLCGNTWVEKERQIDREGYYYVDIYCNGEKKRQRVHRLVAEAFIPDWERTGKVIHHIDQNKLNNNLENLIPLSDEEHRMIHKYLRKWQSILEFADQEEKQE